MKLVEDLSDAVMRDDEKTQYIRYRVSHPKHGLWLYNRKRNEFYIDKYDAYIVRSLNPGSTCAFGFAGYYLDDVIPDLTVVEEGWEIVKKFWPSAHIVSSRSEIAQIGKFDNLIINNARVDYYVTVNELTDYMREYVKCLKPGAKLFYSIRDLMIVGWNRLVEDHVAYFTEWAQGLSDIGLHASVIDVQFLRAPADTSKNLYARMQSLPENPDPNNGNLKFVFTYESK